MLDTTVTLESVPGQQYTNQQEIPEYTYLSPIWLPSPEPDSRAIVAVFAVSQSANASGLLSDEDTERATHKKFLSMETCTISAYWNTGKTRQNLNDTQSADRFGIISTDPISGMQPENRRDISLSLTEIPTLWRSELFSFVKATTEIDMATGFALALSRLHRASLLPGKNQTRPQMQHLHYTIQFTPMAIVNASLHKALADSYTGVLCHHIGVSSVHHRHWINVCCVELGN